MHASRHVQVVRIVLPAPLRTLAGVHGEVALEVEPGREGAITQRGILDALEGRFPALGGTVRDRATAQRRPFIRFFACNEDVSHEPPDAPVPAPVATGREPFIVLGAIAGG